MLHVGTQTHVQWMNMQKNNRDSCTHLVVWKDTGPVRGCGPVRSGDGEPARDEGSRIRLIQTGQTGVGWCFGLRVGAGCCQDRDQLNPPSERRQPLLGHSTPPSSLPSEVRLAKESLFWNGSLYWFSWTDSQCVCKSRLIWESISQFVWLSRKYN